jgi:excisionase family DNA binding protein
MKTDLLMPEDEQPLRIKEVAEGLRVSQKTVRRWIDHGKLISVKMGGLRVILRRDFNAFWKTINPSEGENVQTSLQTKR